MKDHIWHNSNKEQPDGNHIVVCYNINTHHGAVNRFVQINNNHKWAYLEDLDTEFVQYNNNIN